MPQQARTFVDPILPPHGELQDGDASTGIRHRPAERMHALPFLSVQAPTGLAAGVEQLSRMAGPVALMGGYIWAAFLLFR